MDRGPDPRTRGKRVPLLPPHKACSLPLGALAWRAQMCVALPSSSSADGALGRSARRANQPPLFRHLTPLSAPGDGRVPVPAQEDRLAGLVQRAGSFPRTVSFGVNGRSGLGAAGRGVRRVRLEVLFEYAFLFSLIVSLSVRLCSSLLSTSAVWGTKRMRVCASCRFLFFLFFVNGFCCS